MQLKRNITWGWMVVALALLLSACNGSDIKVLASQYWTLEQLGEEQASSFETLRPISFRIIPDRQMIMGSAGCNQLGAKYTLDKKILTFQSPVTTKMSCPAIDVEERFIQMLLQVDGYILAENHLTLLSKGEKVAQFTGTPVPAGEKTK